MVAIVVDEKKACCFPVHGLPNCLVPALDKAGVREFEGRGLKTLALHRPQVARRPPAQRCVHLVQVACRPFQSPRPRESRFASAHPRSPPADTPQHIGCGTATRSGDTARQRPPAAFVPAALQRRRCPSDSRTVRAAPSHVPAAAARAPSAASAPAPSPQRESRAQRAESDCDHHRRKSPPRTHRARLALVTRRCAAASHAPCRVCSAVRESAVHSQRRHATDAGASSVPTPSRARRRPVTYAGPSRFALAPRHQIPSGGGASACCATSAGPSPDVPPLSASPPRVPLAVTPQDSRSFHGSRRKTPARSLRARGPYPSLRAGRAPSPQTPQSRGLACRSRPTANSFEHEPGCSRRRVARLRYNADNVFPMIRAHEADHRTRAPFALPPAAPPSTAELPRRTRTRAQREARRSRLTTSARRVRSRISAAIRRGRCVPSI
ncbi:hypothetical protein B0H15DRAFT_993244 [Mycena belliarum]|uniref:Uncharacterized protein n=1 Tax=Mycena belliarum TaxID=1033014 RepID=A0AAD6XJH4_9AGAR|nr:hypothetical protein B0H15DRAFT_993244 [Mycena belliae]